MGITSEQYDGNTQMAIILEQTLIHHHPGIAEHAATLSTIVFPVWSCSLSHRLFCLVAKLTEPKIWS